MPRPRTVTAAFARVRENERLLYDWLRDHHDAFAAELERTRVRDRWKLGMKVIAQHNLLDGRGKPATQDTAVRTWQRVCADVAAARAKRQAPPPLAPGEIAPGVRDAPAAATAWAGPANAGHAAAIPAGTEPGEESNPLHLLRSSMVANKVPVPKPL